MIRSVSVANVGPFRGEQSAILNEGLLSIEGRYSDKPGESNRAGKSAFIDLIRFGLYGQHRHRVIKDYINRKADPRNDPVYVSLEMDNPDGQTYHIIREFDYASQKFTLSIPESKEAQDMKQGEIQTYIESDLLGCDYINAVRTWLVLQNNTQGIMSLPVADRKKFLLELFAPNAFPWDSYYTETSSRLSICKTRQSEVTSRINNYRNRLYELSGQDFQTVINAAQNNISELQRKKAETDKNLKDLMSITSPESLDELERHVTEQRRKLNTMYNALLLSRKTLDKLKRDAETYNTKSKSLAELEKKKASLNKKVKSLRIKETEEEYNRVYDQHKTEAAGLALAIQQYSTVEGFSGVCPVTKQECTSGSDICSYRDKLEKDIQVATKRVDGLEQRIDQLVGLMEANDTVRRDLSVIENNIESVNATLSHLENACDLYEEHKAQNASDEEEYIMFKADVDKLVAELDVRRNEHDLTYARRIRELKQQQQTLEQSIADAESNLKLLIADEQRKSILEEELAAAQREYKSLEGRRQVLQCLKPMLSADGIPFTYLISAVTDFEKSINDALAELGSGMTLDIEPYTQLSSLVDTCPECGYEYDNSRSPKTCPVSSCNAPRPHKKKETLEFRIIGSFHDVNYDEDSGGGQQWISMGVRFALFNILRSRGLMENIDFWSLDEVFAPLSEVSKFTMLGFLENIRNVYDIRQLFLITHTDISAVVPPSIIIERSDAEQESHILS